MKAKYINSFTDYGLKKSFREEASKRLLISFLNDLLPIRDKIINPKIIKGCFILKILKYVGCNYLINNLKRS